MKPYQEEYLALLKSVEGFAGALADRTDTDSFIAAAREAERNYLNAFLGREAVALFEADGGYTENYLRVYAAGAREGMLARVKLIRPEKDGAFAEIVEETE